MAKPEADRANNTIHTECCDVLRRTLERIRQNHPISTPSKIHLWDVLEGAVGELLDHIAELEKEPDFDINEVCDTYEVLHTEIAQLKAENAELHTALDDILYEPDVSQDELFGYVIRRTVEDYPDAEFDKETIAGIKDVIRYIDEFYADQAEGDCVDCEVCD